MPTNEEMTETAPHACHCNCATAKVEQPQTDALTLTSA